MSRIQKPFPGMPTPATYEAGSEFIDREPQWPASREYQNDQGEARAAASLPNAPLGEPPIDVDVRSTYDVRPIQAFDVNLPLLATDAMSRVGSEATLTATVEDVVPLGYVFVLRKLGPYFSGAIPPVVFRNQALLTLRKNHGDVQFNINVPIGADCTDLDVFTIYDEGEQYGARCDLNILIDFPDTFFGCTFYGNFLRKTGRPANQEIGNPVKNATRNPYK